MAIGESHKSFSSWIIRSKNTRVGKEHCYRKKGKAKANLHQSVINYSKGTNLKTKFQTFNAKNEQARRKQICFVSKKNSKWPSKKNLFSKTANSRLFFAIRKNYFKIPPCAKPFLENLFYFIEWLQLLGF